MSNGHIHLPVDASGTRYVWTASKVAVNVGVIDARIELEHPALLGANRAFMGKWGGALDRSWFVQQRTSGQLRFTYTPDGTLGSAVELSSGAAVPFGDNDRFSARVTFNPDTGSGYECKFYVASEWGTWTQLGSTLTGAATVLHGGADRLSVIGVPAGIYYYGGKVYRFQLRDGVNGTIVADPDWRTNAQGWPLNSPDGYGNTWTVEGTGVLWIEPTVDDRLDTPGSWVFAAVGRQRTLSGSWSAVANADHYDWEVQVEVAPGSWLPFREGSTTQTSFTLGVEDGVAWGGTYRARVQAVPAA
jgi:hypothetical protein